MSKLRDNEALCEEVAAIVINTYRDLAASALATGLILDAVDRHLAPKTLYQCPPGCLRGLPVHSEGCPNRAPAAHPGHLQGEAAYRPFENAVTCECGAKVIGGSPAGMTPVYVTDSLTASEPVAFFRYADQAVRWAGDNYMGRYQVGGRAPTSAPTVQATTKDEAK